MQLKEGIFYKTRDGRKSGPARYENGRWSSVSEGTGRWYFDPDGKLKDFQEEDCEDLIAEWKDEPTGPVRTRTVTEIVDGNYGIVMVYRVNNEVRVELNCSNAKAKELRAAADVFIQLADALEGK